MKTFIVFYAKNKKCLTLSGCYRKYFMKYLRQLDHPHSTRLQQTLTHTHIHRNGTTDIAITELQQQQLLLLVLSYNILFTHNTASGKAFDVFNGNNCKNHHQFITSAWHVREGGGSREAVQLMAEAAR